MNKKRMRLSYIKIFRTIIQAIFFVLLPGLYANAFLGVRLIYQSILQHNFNITSTLPQLISVIVIIPITILFGRFFCGWMCAFGTLGDMLFYLSRKVFRISYRINEKADHILKYVKYILLVYIILVAWTLQAFDFSFFSPWDAFGNLLSFTSLPNFSYVIANFTIGFILLLVITAGSLLIERFFCRYLCPLGAVFALISHLRFIRIQKPHKDCGPCKACTKKCTMGIPLYQMDSVSTGECINCMKCVPICPRNNVNAAVVNAAANPALAGALAVTAIAGGYYIGTFAADSYAATQNTAHQAVTSAENSSIYEDGTYEGSGTGFRGATTTVSVTILGGTITDIQAESYGDDKQFFDRAFNTIVSEVISAQSFDVDAVSGATFSSNGIMEAVSDALNSAKQASAPVSDTVDTSPTLATDNTAANTPTPTEAADITPDHISDAASSDNKAATATGSDTASSSKAATSKAKSSSTSSASSDHTDSSSKTTSNTTNKSSSKSTGSTTDSSADQPAPASKYKNGVYEGSGTGFRGGTTTVSVTIKDDIITDIAVISNEDTPQFFDRASSAVTSEILNTQSADVDTVSGATFSSMGIMDAVTDALNSAEIN